MFNLKQFALTLSAFLVSLTAMAQTFSCPDINADKEKWISAKIEPYSDWAVKIANEGIYKKDSTGNIEYVYIITSSDTFNIKKVRSISMNFLAEHFTLDNAAKAAIETNSTDTELIFTGKFPRVGEYSGADDSYINAIPVFDIKFKPNRIRFSIKIQYYQVLKYSLGILTENYTASIPTCFPLNPKSAHKKSFAKAFINSNAKCLVYSGLYLDYLNKHTDTIKANDTDW